MTEPRFTTFLRASLALIADEAPELAARAARQLGAATLGVEVDDARLSVRGGARLEIDVVTVAAEATVRTNTGTIRALLHGDLAVLDAILADHLELVGATDTIVQLEHTLFLYLNATVRSPGHPALMRRFLDEAT